MGLFDFVGPAVSGIASYFGGREANRANMASADKQMDFQERMSSTAYQRAMADMKAGGLNPMLAYQQGSESSPGGASYSAGNVLEGVGSSAMQGVRLAKDLKEIQSRIDLNQASTGNQAWGARLKSDQAREARANATLAELEIPASLNLSQWEAKHKGAGAVDAWLKRLSRGASTVRDVGIGVGALRRKGSTINNYDFGD